MRAGHEVRLIPPNYIKPYLRRQKNDAADAAAIREAVTRPSMRFVPVKSQDQQATLMLHSARELLISQRTALINALRGHFAELGIVAPQGAPLMSGIAILEDEQRSPEAGHRHRCLCEQSDNGEPHDANNSRLRSPQRNYRSHAVRR
jgi:transposase